MESHIYRHDHILGLIEGGLGAELYRSWGVAIGGMLSVDSLLVVSSDIRASSAPFKAALVEGLLSSGVRVIDIGILPTELAAYARDTFSASGFVSVSGDWHSACWNGLRWRLEGVALSISEQVLRLCEVASAAPLVDVAGVHLSMSNRLRKYDITYHWVAWAQGIWHDANQRPMRIVVDAMYGSWARVASNALRAIFPQVQIESLRDVANDNFGGVVPNSRIFSSIASSCKAVRKRRAEFGVVLDADAGNFTIIDDCGEPLTVEETHWLFIRHILCDGLEGENLLCDVACSEVLLNEAIRLGASPVISGMTSDRFIDDMRKSNALIGLTSDGALYFRGIGGSRIVVFAISWVIDYMLCATFKLSDWRKTLPAFHITPELRVNYNNSVEELVKVLSVEWSSTAAKTIDGYSFSGTAAKVHIRMIGGYGQVGFRFESKSRDGLDNIVQKCCIALSNFANIATSLEEQYKKNITIHEIISDKF
ncbi:MAG: hypothetical protein LBP59_07890 [Planctomycetaceae bacterium]|jgi:phosphomannomutase|nr:hypothetical protein [Planctomycetaceae bacterium]